MTDIDLEDASLQRIVRAAARRMVRVAATRGHAIGLEDLIQEGYLGLLVTRRRFNPEECTWETWVWSRAREQMRNCLALRTNLHGPRPITPGMAYVDPPEPTAATVLRFAGTSDQEAGIVILACGLDGHDRRSLSDVAWMLGRHTANVCREYRRGMAKIRSTY